MEGRQKKKKKKNRLKASFHFVQYELSQDSHLAHTVKQRKNYPTLDVKCGWYFVCVFEILKRPKRLVELRAWRFDDWIFKHLSPGRKMRTEKIKADLSHYENIRG